MIRAEAKLIVADEVISNEMFPQGNVGSSLQNLADAWPVVVWNTA